MLDDVYCNETQMIPLIKMAQKTPAKKVETVAETCLDYFIG